MLIIAKWHLCSHPHGSNPVVASLCQQMDGNKYDEDLEMEIQAVIKTCTN